MGEAFVFVATCPTCGREERQNAFTRAALERLLNGGYPIEAYCSVCDEFWTVGIQKRVEIIEAVANNRAAGYSEGKGTLRGGKVTDP